MMRSISLFQADNTHRFPFAVPAVFQADKKHRGTIALSAPGKTRSTRTAITRVRHDSSREYGNLVPVGSNGMFCTFSDTMNYIAWKHAAPAFINFSIDAAKFNRAVFYRSILENAALVSLSHKMLVESITGDPISGILFASGASKSNLWCSIVADTLGVPVSVPKTKEATALGAAILAGVGAGVYSDLSDTAGRLCTVEKTYEPNLNNHQIYLELFNRWKSVYKNQLKLADEGYTQHMWKAPGL